MIFRLFRRKKVKVVSPRAKRKREITSCLVSSLFLHENFELMKRSSKETFYYVTGPEAEGVRVLDHIEEFGYEVRNEAYAKAVTIDSTRILIKIQNFEHQLGGYFHSHTTPGRSSTMPSSVDYRLRDTFDRGGHKAIGAIFSSDGFVRFFSSQPFRIQIYGEGVEKINEYLYHLVEIG